MLRQVRGSGTLVPEDIRWIPATTQGRVERILLRPGAEVTPDTVILELSNPDLQQAVKDAQLAFQSAQAAFVNRKADLESAATSASRRTSATIEAQLQSGRARPRGERAAVEGRTGLGADVKQKRSAGRGLKNRLKIAQQRLEMHDGGHQVAARAAGSGRQPEAGGVRAAAANSWTTSRSRPA